MEHTYNEGIWNELKIKMEEKVTMRCRRNSLYCSLRSRWQWQCMLKPGPSKEIGMRNKENTQWYSNYCLLGPDFNVRSPLPLPMEALNSRYRLYLLQHIKTLPAAHHNFTSSTSWLYQQHIITFHSFFPDITFPCRRLPICCLTNSVIE